MSKVKFYLDSKQKARHRQRRYETMHKKFSRARKSERREYSRFYGFCGYSVERQKVRVSCVRVKDPRGRTVLIPRYESVGGEVFIVKQHSITARYCKQSAARKFRRNKKFDEDSYILKGTKYKKDYDVQWSMT